MKILYYNNSNNIYNYKNKSNKIFKNSNFLHHKGNHSNLNYLWLKKKMIQKTKAQIKLIILIFRFLIYKVF